MEPVSTMILTALAAGAAASMKDVANQAVKDAYHGLKSLIQKKFGDQRKAIEVLNDFEKDPETWEKPLKKKLNEAGIDQDVQIREVAQQLLKMLDDLPGESKYHVEIKDSQVGAIGDHAKVNMNISKESKKK